MDQFNVALDYVSCNYTAMCVEVGGNGLIPDPARSPCPRQIQKGSLNGRVDRCVDGYVDEYNELVLFISLSTDTSLLLMEKCVGLYSNAPQ